MADNVTLPANGTGSTTPVVATEDISSVQYQKIKLVNGEAGSTTPIPLVGDVANGLDVDVTRLRGPIWGGTGSPVPFTASGSGAQRVTDAHARYMDAVLRGNVWTLSTAYAGVTLVAASAMGQTAWSPIVGVFNPVGSGKNLVIISGFANYVSGTPTAGGVVWGFVAPNAGVTAVGGNSAVNAATLQSGGSTAKTFVMSAMTGALAVAMLSPFPASPFAGAVAATTPLGTWHDVAGLFIVPPGGVIGISGTVGTSTVLQGFLAWEEVPSIA